MRSDVGIPGFQITVGARVNWSTGEGLHVSRQNNLLQWCGALRSSNGNRRQRDLRGFSTHRGGVPEARDDAVGEDSSKNQENRARDDPVSARPGRCLRDIQSWILMKSVTLCC